MRTSMVACCALLLAGCASQPAAPLAFHAPRLADEAEATADEQPLALEGAPDTAAGAAAVTHAPQAASTDPLSDRHVTLLVGGRNLDGNDAEDLDVDDQFMLGLGIDMSDPQTGNGFEAGFEGSGADGHAGGQDTELHLFDIYGGYRKTFHPEGGQVHPYVGGGLAWLHGELDVGPDRDDNTLGGYVRAGVAFDVSEQVRLGVDYRHMWADLDFFGGDFDADFNQLALSLGFAF